MGVAVGSVFAAAIVGFGILNMTTTTEADAGRAALDSLEALGATFPDSGFAALGVVAALIVAIVLSMGQSAQRMSEFEVEAVNGTGDVNLDALRRLRSAESVHKAEAALALLSMAVTAIIAAVAFAGWSDWLLIGLAACLCLAWLAVQIGHLMALGHESAVLRSILDAPFKAALQDRVVRVERGRRWYVIAWWGAYLLPVPVLVVSSSAVALEETFAEAVAVAALFAASTQVSVASASSSGLVEDGWGRRFTIGVGTFVGGLIGMMASVGIAGLFWADDQSDAWVVSWAAVAAWYTLLSWALACGVAGGGPLRAAATRYTQDSFASGKRTGSRTPSRTARLWAWASLALVAVTGPALALGLTEDFAAAAAAAGASGVLLVLVLRTAAFASRSTGWTRKITVALVATLIALGAVWVTRAGGFDGVWSVLVVVIYVAATSIAAADVVDRRFAGTFAHVFEEAQARRRRPLVRAFATGTQPGRGITCEIPGCRNERRR
ncbi:hypothetical protein MHY85_08095 [Cellulomonas sp. ACRRI]|uniref:hypothetical protein n=1 Tax=Cellulomonas sp. ACRRI TaxID=2918188 RepID=UPI001EF231D5|nr:hypothetical protein [Cellulomonas sp. ACRRI]MCG7285936.1 hypothetical protein [Cellulomonas sp. ACRRI]